MMTPQSFAERVLRLEEQMSELSELPKKVDELALQIAHLHSAMLGELSATGARTATEFAALRSEMATKADLTAVRAEIKEGDEETRRHMRVLHEEVIGRLALLQEGLGDRARKKPRGGAS